MTWMTRCYSRILLDNHITDINPEFMSKYSPEKYVEMVRLANVESAMVSSCDHNGNCYYATEIGHMHKGLNGRDIFKDAVNGLRQSGIVPIAYYTLIYHNDSAKRFPHVRIHDINGKDHNGRFHYSCPNQPIVRDFFKKQLAEVLSYDVEGIFIDMTFWPMICCCDACRKRYREESGDEIPDAIDWENPAWVRFQRFRERSMTEFAEEISGFVQKTKPGISVTHQFSPVLHGWYLGQSSGIANASDYAGGDFYGGKLQHRTAIKIFDAYSRKKPCEFMTSRCVSLRDHTSTKSEEELFLHALTTLANGGAYLFIDAINPDGTLEKSIYEKLGRVAKRLEPFKQCVAAYHPSPAGEVGIYFSMASCIDEARNKSKLSALNEQRANMDQRENKIRDEVFGAADILTRMHVPYRIITDQTTDYRSFKVIIIANAAYLSPEECNRLRQFVKDGGTLIATGRTSLFDKEGNSTGNFALSDVFGVDFSDRKTDGMSYLACGGELISAYDHAPLTMAHNPDEVSGCVVLPCFPAGDPEKYASIHSDPPGKKTSYAGLVEHSFGAGKCVYLYSALFLLPHHSQQSFLKQMLKRYLPEFISETRNLPESTEITLLKAEQPDIWLLGVVNYQDELPNIPLYDCSFIVKLPFCPGQVRSCDSALNSTFDVKENQLSIHINKLENGEMFILRERDHSRR